MPVLPALSLVAALLTSVATVLPADEYGPLLTDTTAELLTPHTRSTPPTP
jgi:hypothetical protein